MKYFLLVWVDVGLFTLIYMFSLQVVHACILLQVPSMLLPLLAVYILEINEYVFVIYLKFSHKQRMIYTFLEK